MVRTPARPMSSRLSSARRSIVVAACLAAGLPGCFLVHGREDPSSLHDAGPVPIDVGQEPELAWDGGPGPAWDGGPPPMCASSERAVAVRVEAVTAEAERCNVAHVDGMMVYGLEPVPEEDGVRVRADFCPELDADCRCDIVIANVGIDVLPSLLPGSLPFTLDLQPGAGPGTYVSIQNEPHCRCDGCACSLDLVLYAADGTPETAPHAPPEVSFARGAEICPDLGCVSGTWSLLASTPGATFELAEGAEWTGGALHVRSLRNVDVYGPCAACAMCGSVRGSFVAWAS